jgi:hypothetical protein
MRALSPMFSLMFVALSGFGGAAVSIVGCSDSGEAPPTASTGADSGSAISPAADSGGRDTTAQSDASDATDASDVSDAPDSSAVDAHDSGALIGDGGTCNAIVQQGPANVNVITSTTAPAAALGGTIADGTYVLTAATQHNAAGTNGEVAGSFGKVTRELAGNVLQSVGTTSVQTKRATETVAVNGTTIDLTAVCAFPPVMGAFAVPTTFTATATTLTLYQDLSGGVVVEQVYTKL